MRTLAGRRGEKGAIMMYRLLLSGVLALSLVLLPRPSALAANTWYVNGVNGKDTNTCTSSTTACKTIGHAIALAASGDAINVAAATYTENLTIPISLTIDGAGATTTIINGHVDFPSSTSTVTLRGVTIQNGSAVNGGGIFNSGGTLTITNSTISGNTASGFGGGFGGGIYNSSGTLTLRNVTVSGNHIVGEPNSTNPEGGGIYNSGGTLTITNSTVSDNSMNGAPNSGFGGGIYNGGGTLTIASSTITGNGLQDQASGALLEGGGIDNEGGKVMITRSTISDNYLNGSYADGGGSFYGGGIWSSGTMSISSSTISGNGVGGDISSGIGGGIYNVGALTIASSTLSNNSAFGFTESFGGGIDGGATLVDTIVANNVIGINSTSGNCQGGITSHGYNLSSDNTCALAGPGDLKNTNPLLGPLQNNGGPTQTQALLAGSPAIDAGNPAGCTGPTGKLLTTDQRGQPRPDLEDGGVGCDIGAYESQTD